MSSAILIRLGGLVAMLGGLAATILGLLYFLQAWGMTLDISPKALLKGGYEGPVANMLLVGVVAAIVALHFIQRRNYGRLGALASASAIGGFAMVVIGFLVSGLVSGLASDTAFFLGIGLLTVGVVVGSTGIVLLGIVTITARVLPRWCGIALIAGSPPGVVIVFGAIFPLVAMVGNLPPGSGTIGWALAGIPWSVVGFGVFRAAGRRTEQPARVR
jgi:hypothetical protein